MDLPPSGADDTAPESNLNRGSAPDPDSVAPGDPFAPPSSLAGHAVRDPATESVTVGARVVALAETVLVSGFPTQLFLAGLLRVGGLPAFDADGHLSFAFVVTLSLADAALVVTLILVFLAVHGESPRALFLGRRPPGREAWFGLLLVPVVFLAMAAIVAALRMWLPALHNVTRNPLEALLAERRDTWLFLLVLVLAGGLREEVQRAFVLHRFEQYLGGAAVGLVLFSLVFGAGHLEQGHDVAIATACLGFFWGIVYLRRRSIVSTVTSHAGFNLAEAIWFLALTG